MENGGMDEVARQVSGFWSFACSLNESELRRLVQRLMDNTDPFTLTAIRDSFVRNGGKNDYKA
jgi:hypothetical protein